MRWTALSRDESALQSGLVQTDTPDSFTTTATISGVNCVSVHNPHGAAWLYLKLNAGPDLFGKSVKIRVRCLTNTRQNIWIEYDSLDPEVTVVSGAPGAFKRTPSSPSPPGTWMDHEFEIRDLQYTKRINGSDFRVVCTEEPNKAFFVQSVGMRFTGRIDPEKSDQDLENDVDRRAKALVFEVPERPRVSIVVPFLNRKSFTQQLLVHLYRNTPRTYQLILVDDGSLRAQSDFFSTLAGVDFVSNPENLGFARSCNRGASLAKAPTLLFLNNDTIPCPGWLDGMLSCMDRHPNAGIVGGKLIYPESNLIQHAGVAFDSFGLPYHQHRYTRSDSPLANRESFVPAVTGACMLTDTSLFRNLGGFDEQFVNGFEDTDYCLRAQAAGRDVIYCPVSELFHYESISDGRVEPNQEQANRAMFNTKWAAKIRLYTSSHDRLETFTKAKRLGSKYGPSRALRFLDTTRTGHEREQSSPLRFFNGVDRALMDLVRAYFHIRDEQIGHAIELLERVPEDFSDQAEQDLFRQLFLIDTHPNHKLFCSVPETPAPKRLPRVAVYTALFGDYDRLPPVIAHSDCADFICFTDQSITAGGWEIRAVERTTTSKALESRKYKIFPWIHLGDYEYSIYVDANTQLLGRLDDLIGKFLIENDFVAWGHPERNDVVSECLAVLVSKKYPKNPLLKQLRDYLDKGLEYHTGLVEASFLWRRHSNKELRRLMRAWWKHINRFTSRDQISLSYLMGNGHIRPKIMPVHWGNSRENAWFRKTVHMHEAAILPEIRTPSARRQGCVFVYSDNYRKTASTVLRCFQAVACLTRLRPELSVKATTSLNMSNSIVILTKSALNEITTEQLWVLRKRGNVVLVDYIDSLVDPGIVSDVDGLIASSISAYINYNKNFPGKEIVHLTHAVDTRLPEAKPLHRFRAGYFGELTNTVLTEPVKQWVDFHGVNTHVSDANWIRSVKEYSCHYVVRKPSRTSGHKPFLKGFTAAHLGAPVIVEDNNPETDYYLGPDYPFQVRANDEKNILAGVEKARDSFGSKNWLDAVDRTRSVKVRSSHEWYAREFDYLLRIFQ